MANRKFRGINGAVDVVGLNEDFESAQCFDSVWVGELDCFEVAWQDWLVSGHEYARRDGEFWESTIRPHSNFVGMIVQKSNPSQFRIQNSEFRINLSPKELTP